MPKISVLTYSDVMSSGSTSDQSNSRRPVDVKAFFLHLNKLFVQIFYENGDPTKTLFPNGKNWLRSIYTKAVVHAKEFKLQIPMMSPDSMGLQIFIDEKTLFCVVVRGQESRFEDDHPTNRDGVFAVVSLKLFQACVSALVSSAGVHAGLEMAPLGRNAVRGCTFEDDNNWGIHAHSGLNFIANLVWNLRDDECNRGLIKRLPPMEHVMAMAYRMDSLNQSNDDERDKVPTILAIMKTTGMTVLEAEEMALQVKGSLTYWKIFTPPSKSVWVKRASMVDLGQ